MSTNPYESPQGTESSEAADGIWFPWPLLRRFVRPLVTLAIIAGLVVFLAVVVGSQIESARKELHRTRAESVARMRQPVGGGLSGNRPANQP